MRRDLARSLSGDRLTAVYQLDCPAGEAEARARAICVEQTVEFPEALIADEAIREQIIGRVAALRALGQDRFEAAIEYPVEAAGRELTQLVNVLFGNIALQPGVRLTGFTLPESLARQYPGPRFGVPGLRRLLDVAARPLLCTALKPMGLAPAALADLAYRLALGGIDLIKDDHGLADQSFCPFDERVQGCAEAVRLANRKTGRACLYLPNVTAPAPEVAARAHAAKQAGAGGLLVCPGLVGLDAMRALAEDDALALPILSHPAFLGGLCLRPDAGLSHGVLYGQLARLAGADGSIFPHAGGRFAFSEAECRDLVAGLRREMGSIRSIWPVPAGGLRLERVAELRAFYGADCILLIGGDLHAQGADLVASCRRFVELASAAGQVT